MKTNYLELPENITGELLTLPETGMGYQLVRVFLKGGRILPGHKVLNASVLVLENDEHFSEEEIEKVELEK